MSLKQSLSHVENTIIAFKSQRNTHLNKEQIMDYNLWGGQGRAADPNQIE